MYKKNLTEDLRLRLSPKDMEFLRSLSEERGMSVSEIIRSIIGEYRRSLDTLNVLNEAIAITRKKQKEEGRLSNNGDTKTYINDKL